MIVSAHQALRTIRWATNNRYPVDVCSPNVYGQPGSFSTFSQFDIGRPGADRVGEITVGQAALGVAERNKACELSVGMSDLRIG